MTDQYYEKEDAVQETAETTAENYLAQAGSLDGLVQQTADGLNGIEQNLGWIYQQAEAVQNEDMKLAVSNTWQLAQENAVRVTQLDAARLSSIAMMKKMSEYHAKIAGELDEIEEAINDLDEDHPLLFGFGEAVREDERNNMSDDMWSDSMEIAYENVFTELHEGIREATGCADWRTIYNLTDLLTGNGKVTDEQKHLLNELLNTLRDPQKAAAS